MPVPTLADDPARPRFARPLAGTRRLCPPLLAGLVFAVSLCAFAFLGAPAEALAGEPSYKEEVWPILRRHCWGCHSRQDPQGGLKLDAPADLLAGGDSGPLFVPGKPEESLLIKMISGEKPEMPKEQPSLSAEKVEVLRRWVAAGSKLESTPETASPAVSIPAEYRFPAAITSVSLRRDGNLAAVACRSEVVLLDLAGEAPPRRLPTESDLLSHVEFNPEGTVLAAAGGAPGKYGEVRFINPADGAVLGARRIGHDTLFRGGFSPDGKTLAVGGPDGAVYLVPVDPSAELKRFELHTDWVLDVAYSPDGKLLVSGGRDKATKISSAEDGALLRAVDASPEPITSVAASELFAVSAGRARTLIGYDIKIALSGVAVGGAGNGAQPITKKNEYTKPFEGQPGEVLDLAASADRKVLAVAGAFGEVRVYKIDDRQRTALVSKIPAPAYSIDLAADATRLAVGTKSGELHIYELPSGALLKSIVPVPLAGR